MKSVILQFPIDEVVCIPILLSKSRDKLQIERVEMVKKKLLREIIIDAAE